MLSVMTSQNIKKTCILNEKVGFGAVRHEALRNVSHDWLRK